MKKCASAQFTTAGFLRSIHARSAIHAPKTQFTGAVKKRSFFTAPFLWYNLIIFFGNKNILIFTSRRVCDILQLSIRDSNLNRFKEAFFGAFCRFLLACRQASGVGNNKNHSKNALFKVRSSFCEQFFCSDKENREVNPVGLTSGLTQYERKNCRKNRFVFGSLMLNHFLPHSPRFCAVRTNPNLLHRV